MIISQPGSPVRNPSQGDALSGSPEVDSGNCLLCLVDNTIRVFPARHPSLYLTSMESEAWTSRLAGGV